MFHIVSYYFISLHGGNNMSQITLIAPHMSMLEMARAALGNGHNDIAIEQGLLSEGAGIATSLAAKGTEIIITRGGTASAIKAVKLPVTIVEIPITGFDIIRTVEKAKLYGRHIGAVSFASMLEGIDCLNSILNVDIRRYPINDESEAESQVLQAFHNGADVVIGGFITARVAKEHHFPFELINSGVEGILQAAQEAKRIAHARNLEKTKTSLFRAVLDYAYEGIISIDSNYHITFFNPIAERITGTNGTNAIGQKITQIWPALNLDQVMHTGKDDLGQILTINEVDVLCNKVALNVNNKTVGAVVTFQDVSQIQQMEARVRRRIYASGHIANFCFKDIEKTSTKLTQTIEIAKKFALTPSSILLIGETGTGKEVFAQSIHNYSGCHQGPFVAINCAALPGQILESELFGYVGGAFTGATAKGKPGLFEVAHDGTIFLDEIAEMDYLTQGKLLRVLQEKKVMRLGSDRVIPINVRIIAATNKNLKTLVKENKFRADLYYRLNVLQLKIPPLRERKKDIELLANSFLKESSSIVNPHLKLTASAIKVLTEYPWPGNIRELKNVIERVIAVHEHEFIDSSIIKLMLEDQQDSTTPASVWPDELEEIKKALTVAKGNLGETARILGISRSTLWRKLKRLDLKK
jgi:PAS domain S-box-containing protein